MTERKAKARTNRKKGKDKNEGESNGDGQNAGISPLRRQKTPPPVEMTIVRGF
jgi:hypothetical protein